MSETEEEKQEPEKIRVELISFGYKNGGVKNADLMVSLIKLPNPSYQQRKRYTGLDKSLRDELFENPKVISKYINVKSQIRDLFKKLPQDKESVIIALGCHSGRHRSVAMVEKLSQDIDYWKTLPVDGLEIIHKEL